MAANPGIQVALLLGLKLHRHPHFFDQLPQPGIAVGLEGEQIVDENQADVVGQILKQALQPATPLLIFEQVIVVHHQHGPVVQHGEGVHTVGQSLQVQVLPLKHVEVKGLRPGGQ